MCRDLVNPPPPKKVSWKFHLHTLRHSCNSTHSSGNCITSSSIDSNSGSTSSGGNINVLLLQVVAMEVVAEALIIVENLAEIEVLVLACTYCLVVWWFPTLSIHWKFQLNYRINSLVTVFWQCAWA